jgi:hypothetical protein
MQVMNGPRVLVFVYFVWNSQFLNVYVGVIILLL